MSEFLAGGAAILGALLFLASAVGLLRFPDFFTRLHAPTKAATLGVMLIALASVLWEDSHHSTRVKDALLVAFLIVTMPVSAQVLSKAALRRKERQSERTRGTPPGANMSDKPTSE